MIRNIYLSKRFLPVLFANGFSFVIGSIWDAWYPAAMLLLLATVVVLIVEIIRLFSLENGIAAKRKLPDRLSNGDFNPIEIEIENNYAWKARLEILDELPVLLQNRSADWDIEMQAGGQKVFTYEIRPTTRGEYTFGKLRIFVSGTPGLLQRRYSFMEKQSLPVYPSFLHLKKYELQAFGSIRRDPVKAVRQRLGHSMEFEQIKSYVSGDPEGWINWKATARKNTLMVNQYAEEKSKDLYCIVDSSRLMMMPFEGMSLLDYAINGTLAVSHIAIKSGDRAGLITFGQKIQQLVKASKNISQMNRLMQSLYNIQVNELDSNFELLSVVMRRRIPSRAVVLLFTNFETEVDLERQLPYLRLLNRYYNLVVIFFRNTELESIPLQEDPGLKEAFLQTIAEQLRVEKASMVRKLKMMGIPSLITAPYELSTATINKYLEIKRGIRYHNPLRS